MDYEEIKAAIEKKLSKKRFNHSLSVVETALAINKDLDLGLSEEKIKLACILHDSAKENEDYYFGKYQEAFDLDEKILKERFKLHCHLGPLVASQEYQVEDKDILNAIRNHTTGRENMTSLEKLVYLADAIEPYRSYPGVDELRRLAKIDLDQALLATFDHTIVYLIGINAIIDIETVKARNYLKEN